MSAGAFERRLRYIPAVSDQSQPTRLASGGDPTPPHSSFPSIEEGRFPAGTNAGERFRILGLACRGGMGEVYRALDLTHKAKLKNTP